MHYSDFEVKCDLDMLFAKFTHTWSCWMDVQLKEGCMMMMILYL